MLQDKLKLKAANGLAEVTQLVRTAPGLFEARQSDANNPSIKHLSACFFSHYGLRGLVDWIPAPPLSGRKVLPPAWRYPGFEATLGPL